MDRDRRSSLSRPRAASTLLALGLMVFACAKADAPNQRAASGTSGQRIAPFGDTIDRVPLATIAAYAESLVTVESPMMSSEKILTYKLPGHERPPGPWAKLKPFAGVSGLTHDEVSRGVFIGKIRMVAEPETVAFKLSGDKWYYIYADSESAANPTRLRLFPDQDTTGKPVPRTGIRYSHAMNPSILIGDDGTWVLDALHNPEGWFRCGPDCCVLCNDDEPCFEPENTILNSWKRDSASKVRVPAGAKKGG